jgi:hypothetical protein
MLKRLINQRFFGIKWIATINLRLVDNITMLFIRSWVLTWRYELCFGLQQSPLQ